MLHLNQRYFATGLPPKLRMNSLYGFRFQGTERLGLVLPVRGELPCDVKAVLTDFIVTAQGKMDLERKGKQSYQGWMFARLLTFSNGDLQALYDRSDGFYRRQLVLTTKEKQVDRADDPDLAEKMKAEAEGIFLWAFEGLQRLVAEEGFRNPFFPFLIL